MLPYGTPSVTKLFQQHREYFIVSVHISSQEIWTLMKHDQAVMKIMEFMKIDS